MTPRKYRWFLACTVIACGLTYPAFGQLGSGTLPIWDVVDGTTSYQMLPEMTTSSAFLNQVNQQGQAGYRYRHPWTIGSPATVYVLYVRDNTVSRTYTNHLLSLQTTASAYLSQMNQQGSAGYLYVYPLIIGGDTYAFYVKDNSAGRTFTYTYYELATLYENSSDALSHWNHLGTQGYMWLMPEYLDDSIYTFFVKDTTSGHTYSYRKVSGGTSLSTLNQQGQDGYLYLTPEYFSDGIYDIYIKDNNSSRTYSYRVLPDSLATMNQQGSEEYEYLMPLEIGDIYVKVGTGSSSENSPNLTLFTPDGWSDKVVVSKTAGAITDSNPLYLTDALYVNWAVVNNGAATAGGFSTALYVDGWLETSWQSQSLNPTWYAHVAGYLIGTLPVGLHTIKVVTDFTGTIEESDEGDNEYTKTIMVTTPPGGTLRFKSSPCWGGESGGSVRIYVSRTGGSYGAASVNCATVNGTATAGSDYSAKSETLNWSDGDTADKYFDVTILNDPISEGNETFTVSLSAASGASLGGLTLTTVIIYEGPPRAHSGVQCDFDGNGSSDLAVFNPANGSWYIRNLMGQALAWQNQWGWSTAWPVVGDYNGDGTWDQAVFDTAGGYWYIKTLNGTVLRWADQWGWSTAKPVPGDYNGDGTWDQAVFDTAGGYWYIKTVTGGVISWADQWGWSTAKPVPGDYNGDGTWDQAVFDTAGGYWYIKTVTGAVIRWADQWGWSTAKPVPGDYDGDGTFDQAVFDTAGGYWYIKTLAGGVVSWANQWGWSTAKPVSGDFDGDGVYDLAVYDTAKNLWYIKSLDGRVLAWGVQWGFPGCRRPTLGD